MMNLEGLQREKTPGQWCRYYRLAGAWEFEDPVSACLVKTVKNARMTLTVLTDLKSIKAARKPAIFFSRRLENLSVGAQVRLGPRGIAFPAFL